MFGKNKIIVGVLFQSWILSDKLWPNVNVFLNEVISGTQPKCSAFSLVSCRPFSVDSLSDFVSSVNETVPYSVPGTCLSSSLAAQRCRSRGSDTVLHRLTLLNVLRLLHPTVGLDLFWRWHCDWVLAARANLEEVLKVYENSVMVLTQ